MINAKPDIAVLGGTGELGAGLVYRLAKAGYRVCIGSRTTEKAQRVAKELLEKVPDGLIQSAANPDAAAGADLVIMTVPFASHAATLETVREQVQGKIFVDTTVPLVPPKVMRVQLPEGGSAAKITQQMFGEDVRVVSAFHNIAASHLYSDHFGEEAGDVLVCGNNPAARQMVIELAEDMGMKAWHAGAIDNSTVAEALTSILIFLNKKYGFEGAGIQITGKKKSQTS